MHLHKTSWITQTFVRLPELAPNFTRLEIHWLRIPEPQRPHLCLEALGLCFLLRLMADARVNWELTSVWGTPFCFVLKGNQKEAKHSMAPQLRHTLKVVINWRILKIAVKPVPFKPPLEANFEAVTFHPGDRRGRRQSKWANKCSFHFATQQIQRQQSPP